MLSNAMFYIQPLMQQNKQAIVSKGRVTYLCYLYIDHILCSYWGKHIVKKVNSTIFLR